MRHVKPLPLQLKPLCWKCGGGYGPMCWLQGEFLRFLSLLCGNSIGGSVNCGNCQAKDTFIYYYFFPLAWLQRRWGRTWLNRDLDCLDCRCIFFYCGSYIVRASSSVSGNEAASKLLMVGVSGRGGSVCCEDLSALWGKLSLLFGWTVSVIEMFLDQCAEIALTSPSGTSSVQHHQKM